MASFKAFSCLMSIDNENVDQEESDRRLRVLKSNLQSFFTLEREVEVPMNDGSMFVLSANEKSAVPNLTATIRVYRSNKLITINIESSGPLIEANGELRNADPYDMDAITTSNNFMDKLRNDLSDAIGVEVERLPVLKRGQNVPNYFTSSDDRILEYDFDKVVFDARSEFQQVRILHSKTLGNALILDGLQNLAESDISYTHGLMRYGEISYEQKTVLILGGGDGALLYELLKENPKHVTMVDIDNMVMDACKIHMRSVCGSVLDNFKGDNYDVIVGDCIQYLQDCVTSRKKFDFIFNDLTDIPIVPESSATGRDLWEFIRNILQLSFQCLNDNGKYLNHAIGTGSIKALEMYENLLSALPTKVEFNRHSSFVPSFLEEYFYYCFSSR